MIPLIPHRQTRPCLINNATGAMTTMLGHYQRPVLSVQSAFVTLHRSPIRRFPMVSDTARYSTEPPDGQNQEDTLLDWATDTTFSNSVHIAPSAYGGCGLFASKPAKAGDVLLVVPSSKCIALSSATGDQDFGQAFEQLANDGGPGGRKAALAGFVAKEILLNKYSDRPSKWRPYLNLLPWKTGSQDHFLWWSDEEIEDYLFDSNSCDEIISFRTGIEYACEILMEMIHVDDFPWVKLTSPISDHDVEEAIMGAFVCIYSRAFEDEIESCTKLIPVLDMAQHSNDPNLDHESDRDGNVIVSAVRDLHKNEELSIAYLDANDEEDLSKFAIFYGFIPGEGQSLKELVDERNPNLFPSEK